MNVKSKIKVCLAGFFVMLKLIYCYCPVLLPVGNEIIYSLLHHLGGSPVNTSLCKHSTAALSALLASLLEIYKHTLSSTSTINIHDITSH